MTASALQRCIDDHVLQLNGLVHGRALLEIRGASQGEIATFANEAARVRAELARLAKAQSQLLVREAA